MKLTFRRANAADAAVIAEFNCRLATETENRTLPLNTVLNGVVRGLQQGDEVQYWLAESSAMPACDAETDHPAIVGQLMLTREWSDWRDGWIIWLQSVYVTAEVRRHGVFRALFQHVTEQLQKQPDVVSIRLYVEHHNQRAMQTYVRLGFEDAGYMVMECPVFCLPPGSSVFTHPHTDKPSETS